MQTRPIEFASFDTQETSASLVMGADARRLADLTAKRAWTPASGPHHFSAPLSLSLEDMERPPPVLMGTGDHAENATSIARSAQSKVTFLDPVARSAKERVALLARKFARGDLSAEDEARVEVATQRVSAAYRRATPEAFERLARLSESAANGVTRAREALQELEQMGL